MMKKGLLIGVTAVAASVTLIFTFAGKPGDIYLGVKSNEVTYSLRTTPSKNIITEASDYEGGVATIKTELGNDINITYDGLKVGGNSWQMAKPSEGYFYNSTPLHGLQSIEFMFSTLNSTFTVYWSNSTIFNNEDKIVYNNLINSRQTCDFNGDLPSYFKFMNTGGITISLWGFTAQYSCLNSHPYLNVTSEDEDMGTVSGDSGYVLAGSEVTVVASPNQGYRFVGWYSGENLVSNDSSYTFTMGYVDLNLVAKFTYEQYNLVVSSENNTKGTVSNSSGNYNYQSNVSISATPNNGYSFAGWYDGEDLVSSDNPYVFAMPHENLSYVAKFNTNSYTLTLDSNNLSYGTVSGGGTYAYGSSVTAIASPKEGVSFAGWYDDGDNFVSSLTSYTFSMPYENYTLHAVFTAEIYTLQVSSANNSKGVASGGGSKIYGSTVTVSLDIDHGRFIGWYDGLGNFVSCMNPYSFKMPRKDYQLTARFMSDSDEIIWNREHGVTPVYDSNNETVTYGMYPQSHVTDDDLISILESITVTDINDWTIYDNEYYLKIKGAPFYTSGYTFDDGTPITRQDYYWFKCEPIVWNVLSNTSGNYYLLSSVILDGRYYIYSSMDRTIEGKTVTPNNYKYSDIRTWLNGTFLSTAFNLGSGYIQTTTVNNSASTTRNNTNQYACDNTSDRIFLASYRDYLSTSYGFANNDSSSSTRYCRTSEYARSNYAYSSTDVGTLYNGIYMTRSPSNANGSDIELVQPSGSIQTGMGYSYSCGVRPAMVIRFS